MYWVYIIRSELTDRYYIGQTDNLEKRIIDHRSGKSTYTSIASDWYLVFSKGYTTRTQAQRVENFIKKQKSRVFIKKVIDGNIDLDF